MTTIRAKTRDVIIRGSALSRAIRRHTRDEVTATLRQIGESNDAALKRIRSRDAEGPGDANVVQTLEPGNYYLRTIAGGAVQVVRTGPASSTATTDSPKAVSTGDLNRRHHDFWKEHSR